MLCFGLSLMLLACGEKQGPSSTPMVSTEAGKASSTPMVSAEAGKAIVSKNCVGCHGLDGKGVTPDIPNLAAQIET